MTTSQNHFFIYGALLCPSYLEGIVPGARFLCTGHAEGWGLEFHGQAAMVPREDSTVFGALYELSDRDLRVLERAKSETHHRERVTVDTERAESVVAFSFVANDDLRLPGEAPNARYLEMMESGYRAHNAPAAAWDSFEQAHQRARLATQRRDDALAAAEDATWD